MKRLLLPLPLLLLLLPFTTTTTSITTTTTTTSIIPTTTTTSTSTSSTTSTSTSTSTSTTTTTPNNSITLDSIYKTTAVASTGITYLGIRVFQALGAHNNIMLSPYSIWSLLTLILTGADGRTEEELRDALGIRVSRNGIISLLKSLEQSLEMATTIDNKVSVDVAHRVYVHKEFSLQQSPKELSDWLTKLDLSQSESAANTINDFVSNATKGLITDIISPDMLGLDTRMVALNALYFKGSWTKPFPKQYTWLRPFYVTPDSEPVMVSTMFMRRMPVRFGNSFSLKARVLQLSYSSGLFFMTILLPHESGDLALNYTINNLSPFELWQTTSRVYKADLDVTMPKFEIKSEFQEELKTVLRKMGIKDLFTTAADLTSFGGEQLYLKHIIHKGVVKVDEEGTEAAVATGGSGISKMKTGFHLSRPFVFYIHDIQNILFIGTVKDPSKLT